MVIKFWWMDKKKAERRGITMGVPRFTITKLRIGEYEVPVPEGLSELLNDGGAWTTTRKEGRNLKEYERKVEMKNGQIITTLIKK
jgi:hypothetical protein